MKDLIERLIGYRDGGNPDKDSDLIDEVVSAMEQQAAEIERHKQDWNRFHHIMKNHGLHPGRTDDDLLEILDNDLAASKVGLHNLRKKNVKARAERDAALAKLTAMKKQEPVAWSVTWEGTHCGNFYFREQDAKEHKARLDAKHPEEKREVVPLYTAPKVEQPLTEQALWDLFYASAQTHGFTTHAQYTSFARAIEAAHGIGGQQP